MSEKNFIDNLSALSPPNFVGSRCHQWFFNIVAVILYFYVYTLKMVFSLIATAEVKPMQHVEIILFRFTEIVQIS